ncbi:aspartic peptidase domain-containing protein [Butyriboletus roseoflavus]|nr:aspartic peptidase domain-containing protein [Butyriboletus roseoflavus]
MSLLLLLLFSLSAVHASPLTRDTGMASLAMSTKINMAGVSDVVQMDLARVQSMVGTLTSSEPWAVNIPNKIFSYTAEIGVGTPPTYHTLVVDTGSSNTWIGASQPFVPTNFSVNTNNTVSVIYGSASLYGEEWLDTVTLTSSLVIGQQSIGIALVVANFLSADGVLGLGPIRLTNNTVQNTFQVPTVTDNLYTQGKIAQEVLGVFFAPVSEPDSNGKLTFGGYDSSAITSAVNYVPITTTFPASAYWGIDLSISYAGTTILPSTAGIVDTGTTLILLASDAYQAYQSLTGATLDPNNNLLMIDSAQYANLKPLSFNVGNTIYDLTPNAQIWPRSLNAAVGGNSSAIYLVFADLGWPSGSTGFDFLVGYGFLQRFYSVFDTTNQRVGFATTMYTDSTTN